MFFLIYILLENVWKKPNDFTYKYTNITDLKYGYLEINFKK